MSLPYSLRLACLCLEAFFVTQLAIGLLVALLSAPLVRWAGKFEASQAAALLFSLRLMPVGVGLAVVVLICVPSYLLFEPAGAVEEVGIWCLGGTLLCSLIWMLAIARTGRATLRSLRYLRRCRSEAREISTVWLVHDCSPGLALLGIFRPRLVVSARLKQALSPEEFSVALRHERAHWAAKDNLKRLLLLLTPDPLPFLRGFHRLDQGWSRFAEWAADDLAVRGDPRLSLALAAALVQVARLELKSTLSPLMSTLIAGQSDLAARVNRLLTSEDQPARLGRGFIAIGALLTTASVLPILTSMGALNWFHSMLEFLMH